MARRSSSKSKNRPQGRRVHSPSRTLTLRLHPLPQRLVSSPLTHIDDRRRFHPDRFTRPAVSIGRRADTKLVVGKRVRPVQPLVSTVKFAHPKRVLICIRRKMRREVLHALGVGGGKVRKPRRNQFSDVGC